MINRATRMIDRIYRRIIASAQIMFHSIRLRPVYAALGFLIVVACGFSASNQFATDSTTRIVQQTEEKDQVLTPTIPNSPGADNTMKDSISNTSNNSSNTIVHSDNSGTTVTVNGQSQSVPANQSFQDSYDTSGNNNTTHTDISVDNNSTGSSRSINLEMHSSTHTSTSTTSDDQP